jgi:nicotinamidase/pyrazinamidase
MAKPNVHLLVIDPQKDFMDDADSALPVPGANADMLRLAVLIGRLGAKLSAIHITLDTHGVIDVAHPCMWQGKDGKPPPPFTIITRDDIEAGTWKPRKDRSKPAGLGGQTLGAYMLGYARDLARRGNYPLMVWPEHCIVGTPGHAIHTGLARAVHAWERTGFTSANIVAKGVNPYTEHYGALMAEVPVASDPATGLNTAFLDRLNEADVIAIAGEALSHCVKATVDQIAANIGDTNVNKLHILTDCVSPIPRVGAGPDFPALSKAWLASMQARGVTLTTSDAFLT